MNDDMKHSPDNGNKNFEDRLKDSAGDWGSKTDKSIQELLYGHYPDLTEKQFALCDMIVSALWDIGLPSYNAIVSTIAEKRKELFHNTDEVETVIKQLIEKEVVESKIHFIWFRYGTGIGCKETSCERRFLRPVRLLDLKDEIEDEAFKIFSTQFESSITKYFGPIEPED